MQCWPASVVSHSVRYIRGRGRTRLIRQMKCVRKWESERNKLLEMLRSVMCQYVVIRRTQGWWEAEGLVFFFPQGARIQARLTAPPVPFHPCLSFSTVQHSRFPVPSLRNALADTLSRWSLSPVSLVWGSKGFSLPAFMRQYLSEAPPSQ